VTAVTNENAARRRRSDVRRGRLRPRAVCAQIIPTRSLGFDGQSLERAFISSGDEVNATIRLWYDDEALSQMMKLFVRPVVPLLTLLESRALGEPIIREMVRTLSTGFGLAVLRAALFFKSIGPTTTRRNTASCTFGTMGTRFMI
jgi:hypothetical protein